MAVEVHADYLKRRYVAAWCSLACLLNFLLVSGACILPLYISHASGNMWIKEAYHFEQPQVTYQNRLYVEISGLKGTALGYRQPFTAVWTTSAAANAMLGATAARPMIIRSSTRDDNLDGTTDEVRISAALPLANDEVATSALVIAYHDVELQDVARFRMDALLVASASVGIPVSRIDIDGDVRLTQRSSLPVPSTGIYAPYLTSGLPSLDSPATLADLAPESIMGVSRGRNYTLRFDVPAPLWQPDLHSPGSLDTSTLATQPRSFTVNIKARIPPGPVLLRPRVTEELKWGWVQYLSFLVLTGAAAWVIRWALFSLRIVETTVLVDAPRTAAKLHVS